MYNIRLLAFSRNFFQLALHEGHSSLLKISLKHMWNSEGYHSSFTQADSNFTLYFDISSITLRVGGASY